MTEPSGKSTAPATPPSSARSLERDVAFVFEVPEALLPVLPELYEGLPDLSGCTPDVLALLRERSLPPDAQVLDLGCGRGEIALAVAEVFGARVRGIDAYAPFIQMAQQQARARNLAERVRFSQGDLRAALAADGPHSAAPCDALLMIALGPVLGGPAATMAALRRAVKPGGLILIDDGYLIGARPEAPGWEDYLPLAEMEAGLTAHGDRILRRLDRREAMAAFDAVADPAVARNVAALSARRPDLAPLLRAYLDEQFAENNLWKTDLMPAMWMLQRA